MWWLVWSTVFNPLVVTDGPSVIVGHEPRDVVSLEPAFEQLEMGRNFLSRTREWGGPSA